MPITQVRSGALRQQLEQRVPIFGALATAVAILAMAPEFAWQLSTIASSAASGGVRAKS